MDVEFCHMVFPVPLIFAATTPGVPLDGLLWRPGELVSHGTLIIGVTQKGALTLV